MRLLHEEGDVVNVAPFLCINVNSKCVRANTELTHSNQSNKNSCFVSLMSDQTKSLIKSSNLVTGRGRGPGDVSVTQLALLYEPVMENSKIYTIASSPTAFLFVLLATMISSCEQNWI